jgi:hypothetical protein
MDWNHRPRRASELEVTEVVDGFVVQRRQDDRVHFLNPTAAFILEICDGSLTAGELPELVAAAFGLEKPPRDDVAACLERLLREGLLIETERN